MPHSAQEEVTIIEELDGQKILSAQLITGPDGDRLVLGLAGDTTVTIKPTRGIESDGLAFEFSPE